MEQNLLKLSESARAEVLHHRELFAKRFDTLFDWSAVLSLEKPNQFDIPKKRASLQPNDGTVKRRKIHVTDLAKISKDSSQLRLVDKSVIERLMKTRNNVNIIRIETMTGPDGRVKPVLAQANGAVATSSGEEVGHEDVQDVEKLNVVLKSMKSEGVSESGSEFQAIKGDVQLLKQILQYEKVKVKAEPDG
ncbi:hypothetical protein TcasGA2_TC031585 [Tribolium castaneum]|uniref:Uncharacterized protein n=1 Tax=Tribolium castaneum TaxID=7070 RepID=A0A139W8J4_TRICA|nr:hypothetical protein TcasGA2_TC031585 [Tribolium castaneum]